MKMYIFRVLMDNESLQLIVDEIIKLHIYQYCDCDLDVSGR